MTDDNQEEGEVAKLAIDEGRLGVAIDRQSGVMVKHGDLIQTRAQQRLQAEVDRKVELQGQLAEESAQLISLRDQREKLDAMIKKGEANVHDAGIELKAVLTSIHTLEEAGISV